MSSAVTLPAGNVFFLTFMIAVAMRFLLECDCPGIVCFGGWLVLLYSFTGLELMFRCCMI